jgi:hypothetical protein
MESTKIEKLINAWLEGETTLQQEEQLRAYFNGAEVAPQFEAYRPMFVGFAAAALEATDKEVKLPATTNRIKPFWYSIAALLVVAFTVGSIVFSGNGLSKEEQEALAALKQTKEVMLLMSSNLNKGTENVALLDAFSKGKESLKYIDQFNQTTNKFLK